MAGILHDILQLLLIGLAAAVAAKADSSDSDSPPASFDPGSLDSTSVVAGLLDSPFTDFVELMEKASVLQSLAEAVGRRNVTILAPPNSCFEGPAQESFRRFLLEPGNVRLLRRLVEFHIVPRRLTAARWPSIVASFRTLSSDFLQFWTLGTKLKVGFITVVAPDAIVRADGVVHGVDAFLVPKVVQQAFGHWKKSRQISEVEAQAPASRRRLIGRFGSGLSTAPGGFDHVVNGLVKSLRNYSEMADRMSTITSELAGLVNEGYRLTVLAPSNAAFAELSEEQLIAPEQTVLYHIIPQYQTQSSLCDALRRFGKVSLETLRFPFKISARESAGAAEFGEGNCTARLVDYDIYADGLISVQGIDKILVPSHREMSSESGLELALVGLIKF